MPRRGGSGDLYTARIIVTLGGSGLRWEEPHVFAGPIDGISQDLCNFSVPYRYCTEYNDRLAKFHERTQRLR